jgi:lysozyme
VAKKQKIKITKRSKKKSKSSIKAIVIGALLIGLSVIAYFYYSKDIKVVNKEEVVKSIPEGFPAFGIDVSHHQGEIDWEKLFVKERYDTIIHFVYCKATEGSDHLDTQWKKNRAELQRLNIPNGAYHFFSPQTEPRPQAAHFLAHWKKSDLDLPPVLDVESEGFSDEDLIAKMKIWLKVVEDKTGMRPIIYTSLNFFETKFINDFKNYKFWIAAYSRKPECIDDSRIIHWQYSEAGELPGFAEKVDLNVSKIALR